MRVLVTNDDGVEAPGLLALARAVAGAGHDTFVVAPSGERSGSGAAIGRLHRAGPIACTEVALPDLVGVHAHAVDATPAAAVYVGCLRALGPPPDVVVSGINPGANYGHLVVHSGTVGAALTAQVLGIPSVAVSIAWGEHQHWGTAAAVAVATLPFVLETTPVRVLNVNVPNVTLGALRGVREARLAPFAERWEARATPGEVHLEYTGRASDPEPDTDVALVHAGYAAVTTLTGVGDASFDGVAAAISARLAQA